MSFDSILTFCGILVAILALVPKSQLLFIKIKLRLWDYLFALFAFMIILYLLFYKTFVIFDLTPGWNLKEYNISPSNTIFIIFLILSVYYFLRIKFSSFSLQRIGEVRNLIENLLQESKYNELIIFLDKYFVLLNKMSKRETVYLKLRDKAKPLNLLDTLKEEVSGKKKRNKWLHTILSPLRILPDYERQSKYASLTLEAAILNDNFIEHIVKSRSYIFIKFFEIEETYLAEFNDRIFRMLLSNINSIIFTELFKSQNLSGNSNYWIVEENKLIYYLLNDPRKAETLEVWRPIGEYIIEKLDCLKRNPEQDIYNTDMQTFYEDSRWKSDIYIGIHFFDVMVSRALHKNVQWHMWLYYYRHFIQSIIKNHSNQDKYYNEDSEWPNKYEYLIYEMFHKMFNWLRSLDGININQENVKLLEPNIYLDDNGNIPWSTTMAINQSLKILFMSKTIGDKFKRSIMCSFFSLYFDLRKNKELKVHSKLLIETILRKYDFLKMDKRSFIIFLKDTYENHFDKIPIPSELLQEFRGFLRKSRNIYINE